MTAAECLIVSARRGPDLDAYVLSESSLFVYRNKVVLKTCGTTKLLEAVPVFLRETAKLGMAPRRVKYTRSTFLFPDEQPMRGDFDRETAFLEEHFGAMAPGGGNAFVLGSKLRGVQWHVYVADDDSANKVAPAAPSSEGSECSTQEAEESAGEDGGPGHAPFRALVEPTVSMEVCMTHLDTAHAKHFVRGDDFISSRHTTEASGIAGVFPDMDIDDYVFEPCGYSMNGTRGSEYSTIHITPEDGFSYCSVEHSNIPLSRVDPDEYVRAVCTTFRPGRFSLAVSTDAACALAADIRRVGPSIPGYKRAQASHQEIDASGGAVSFYTFVKETERPRAALLRARAEAAPAKETPPARPAAGSDKYESDEEAPERKKMKTREVSPESLEYPATPSLGGGNGGGSVIGESRASDVEKARAGSVTNLPALAPGMVPTPMTEFAGLVTLRSSLPTPRPLAHVFGEGESSPELIRAMSERHTRAISGGGPRCVDNCILDVIEDGLNRPAEKRLERFLVIDLGVVTRRFHYWRSVLPRVQPHYAVKCNEDPGILSALAALGASFDCASHSEVETVMSLGVSADRIIYANPCKLPKHLVAVHNAGVGLTTFDSAGELAKIAAMAPDMKVLLRLRADDPEARCVLGNKYGAEPAEVEPLLRAALALGVKVAGCAFHVGSGATNPAAFREALEYARVAFDTAERVGLPPMEVLDIGGGFAGSLKSSAHSNDDDVTLTVVAKEVSESLERLFPASQGVRIISEPGRYFAEACVTLACQVFSRRVRSESDGSLAPGNDSHHYFISDGLYGMMNCVMYDHATVTARVLPVATNAAALAAGNTQGLIPMGVVAGESSPTHGLPTHPSTVFGPTCDGLDKIFEQTALPELTVGDWLVFPHMGAYTVSAGSRFNGFDCADVKKFYVCSPTDNDPADTHVRR